MARIPIWRRVNSLPVRPLRLLAVFAKGALARVPVYALAAGAAMFLAAQVLAWSFGESALAMVGRWSSGLALAGLGVLLGSLVGLAAAAEGVLRSAEQDIRDWLAQLPSGESERLFPSVELDQLQRGYDDAVESLYGSTIGRIPLPGFLRRKIESKFRHVLWDEFLADCQARGVTSVGFGQVRDFMLLKALPVATRPAHAQLRIWSSMLLVLIALCLVVPLLIGLLASHVPPRTLVVGAFGLLGVCLLGWGLPRASGHASPWRYRMGILILGGGLILWPIVWIEMWAMDLGMVWIVVLAVTVWTLHRGARLAFLEADY